MFRFRRWLFCAALALGSRLEATPPLSTIQDVLFTSDGNRFNGLMTITSQSFEASDASNVAAQVKRIQITNGLLYVQLVPTTNANTPAIYTVIYNISGRTQFNEAWAVPPSNVALRVRDVRLASGSVTGGSGSVTPPGATIIQISDVVGLQAALSIRPTSGTGFAPARAAVINATGSLDGAIGNLSDCLHVDGTSAACVSGAPGSVVFVDAEIPSGTVDGSNTVFILAAAPNASSSLVLFRNGLRLRPGGDYTLSGSAITFLTGAVPQPGDLLVASYRSSGSISGVDFIDAETPAGAINGVNVSFTLVQAPIPSGSLMLYRNGIRLTSVLDFTASGNTITFAAGSIPQTGDTLVCSYRIAQ